KNRIYRGDEPRHQQPRGQDLGSESSGDKSDKTAKSKRSSPYRNSERHTREKQGQKEVPPNSGSCRSSGGKPNDSGSTSQIGHLSRRKMERQTRGTVNGGKVNVENGQSTPEPQKAAA